MRLRGRWWQPPTPSAYLPPPSGHLAVVAAGERTMTCPCGWCLAVGWPLTSGRLNRARWRHYGAVETERIARRLGVDVESMLDQVAPARGEPAQLRWPVQPRRVEAAAPVRAVTAGPPPLKGRPRPEESPFREPVTRDRRRAAQARRASAIARVEAARVLPRYHGGDG